MKIIERATSRLDRSKFTFGLREAIILSLVGIAIASAVAWHYAG